jgi:hypothetical protein
MLWAVADRGYLPACEPHKTLPINDYKNTQLVFTLENLGHNLPHYLAERRWREEVVYELRQSAPLYAHNAIDTLGQQPEIERVYLLLSLFANAYVYALHEKPLLRVPKEVSVPISRAAFLCGRQPLINYTSYVLYNWSAEGVINTLTGTETESNIIQVFIETETDFAQVLNRCDVDSLNEFLERTVRRFGELRGKMKSEEFNLLGDLYGDFTNVFYEGWQQKPISYVCNVFAQATFMSALYRLTDTLNKDPLLQTQELATNIYRPATHNNHLASLKPLPVGSRSISLFRELHHEMFMIRCADAWQVPRMKALGSCKTRLGV